MSAARRAPIFMLTDIDRGPYFAIGGLAGMVAVTLGVEAPASLAGPALPLLLALPHALLAVMLLAVLMSRADRWLGRAG